MNQENEVVVAVRAAKEINKTAMEWALNHVVQPGNCIKLLVVVTRHKFGKRRWGFHRFATDCATGHWRSHAGTLLDETDDISDSCLQMMRQLCEVHDSHKVPVTVKILSGLVPGVVAAEAKRAHANWAILDNKLKSEAKHCMEELKCNVVLVKRSQAKVLRLNLVGSGLMEPDVAGTLSSKLKAPALDLLGCDYDIVDAIRVPNVTPISSPEQESLFSVTDIGTSSISSSDQGTSLFFPSGIIENQTKEFSLMAKNAQDLHESDSDKDSELMFSSFSNQPWMLDSPPIAEYLTYVVRASRKSDDEASMSTSITSFEQLSTLEGESTNQILHQKFESKSRRSVREVIALTRHSPADPPPLCSICQHTAPLFGKPPKSFMYAELELATDRFSEMNFLAEGGFGSVYRGVLPDGQVVAVKQHKPASSQGDLEFCSEVEVLSCAQHRNVVMLIGFCVEGGKRLLVYEYICNGSLDSHLFGKTCKPLEWCARKKIAVGAARGLRYLHEECRVGCIVHRDMRPNNILITHDFEPLVGDFGLARCQPDGGLGEETRVIGTLGYLAPEYAQSGQITEKADVYSFGVVLLELITGRKAVDINRPKGEQCLTQWACHFRKKQAIEEMVDPHIKGSYSRQDVSCMLQCAFMCISRDPDPRPRMSQVLRILEGDVMLNSVSHARREKFEQR